MAPIDPAEIEMNFRYPVVAKANKQGSTIGLTIVREPLELGAAIELAYRYDDEVMVEQFVAGRELTVGSCRIALSPLAKSFRSGRRFSIIKASISLGVRRRFFPRS